MIKAKQWLKENGFVAEVTRGRISLDNHRRLAEAAESGVQFSDWAAKVTENAKGDLRVKNAKPAVSGEKVIADISILYPAEAYVALDEDGKRHTTKWTCREHGYSVCGHPCPGGTLAHNGRKFTIVGR